MEWRPGRSVGALTSARTRWVSTLVVVLIVLLALARGAPLEPPANPTDTAYTPTPEWYFLPLYQLLKLVPGSFESLVAVGIPTVLFVVMIARPLFDRRNTRSLAHRPLALVSLTAILGGAGLLLGAAVKETGPAVPPEVGRPLTSAERAGRAPHYSQKCGRSHRDGSDVPGVGRRRLRSTHGIEAPTPGAAPVSAAIPFSFAGDLKAAELFYVTGPNRIAAQVLNSTVFTNGALNQTGSTRKDVGATDQLLLDEKGSAVYAAAYYGTVTGLDNVQPDVRSHYWRLALSANKIIGSDSSNFEALGGVVYGKDLDLPLGTVYALPDNKGYGYWFSGQYYFGRPALTVFSRYEFIDPDTRTADDGRRRLLLGAVLPINLPQYLRLTAEYLLDIPQASGAPKQHSVAGEVQFVF